MTDCLLSDAVIITYDSDDLGILTAARLALYNHNKAVPTGTVHREAYIKQVVANRGDTETVHGGVPFTLLISFSSLIQRNLSYTCECSQVVSTAPIFDLAICAWLITLHSHRALRDVNFFTGIDHRFSLHKCHC